MTDDSTTEDFTTTISIEEEEQEDVAAEDSTDVQSNNDSTPFHLFATVCAKEEIFFCVRSSSCTRSS